MAAAIVVGTVSVTLLLVVCYVLTRLGHARRRAAAPARPVVGPAELDPYELAMLAGGRSRMGEVAVAELFLTGRITAQGPGTVARSAEHPPNPPGSGTAPFVRALLAHLGHDRPLSVDWLVASATRGDAATAVLWRLRRLGLFLAPERLRAVAPARRGAWGAQSLLGTAAVLLAGFAVVWAAARPPAGGAVPALLLALFLAYPFLLHVAHRWIGGIEGAVGAAAVVAGAAAGGARPDSLLVLVVFGGWFAAYAVYRCTGGRLGPRTRAGDAVLEEARAELAERHCADGEALLRATALLGLGRLRRGALDVLRDTPVARDPRLDRLVAFAAACGQQLGAADRGVGGDFDCDGRGGDWGRWGGRGGSAAPSSGARRGGHDRRGPTTDRP